MTHGRATFCYQVTTHKSLTSAQWVKEFFLALVKFACRKRRNERVQGLPLLGRVVVTVVGQLLRIYQRDKGNNAIPGDAVSYAL